MTKIRRTAVAVLFAGLLLPASSLLAQGPPPPGYGPGYNQGPPQGPGYGPGPNYQPGPGGWDAPPSNFTRDIQRRGFADGIYGARKDAENHRSINVLNRDEYRNYRGPARRLYRDAFARGYQAFWSHNGGGGYRPY